MANRTYDLLGQVQAAHQFDHDSLFRYASVHVPGFPSSAASTFTVKQVSALLLNSYQSSFKFCSYDFVCVF
jgi:hypothetical protein